MSRAGGGCALTKTREERRRKERRAEERRDKNGERKKGERREIRKRREGREKKTSNNSGRGRREEGEGGRERGGKRGRFGRGKRKSGRNLRRISPHPRAGALRESCLYFTRDAFRKVRMARGLATALAVPSSLSLLPSEVDWSRSPGLLPLC